MCVAAIFSCIVKVLYNLLYFQVVVQLSCQMTDAERTKWRASKFGQSSSHEGMMSLESVMALVIGLLEQTHLYQLEDRNCGVQDAGTSMALSQADRENVEMKVCVHV
jgi:E3 ubiquitin-protein ligase UBR3